MEDTASFDCPVCGTGQWLDVPADLRAETMHSDCAICCNPLLVRVERESDGSLFVEVRSGG